MSEENKFSQLFLERYVLGEVTENEKQKIETCLKLENGKGPLTDSIARIRQSNEEILREYPAADFARAARHKAPSEPFQVKHWAWAGLAAACLVLAILPVSQRMGTERMKGPSEPTLLAYKKAGDGADKLVSESTARSGDRIQLAYVAGAFSYGAVVSLDGLGQLTVHMPVDLSGAAVPLVRGAETPLPGAFELDSSPSFEKFFFLASKKPFQVEQAVRELRQRMKTSPADLSPLSDGVHIVLFTLRKVN